MLIRASTSRCRSLAAWYSAFSRRSPSSRARLISRGSSVFSSLSSCAISSSNFLRIRSFTSEILTETHNRNMERMERVTSRQNAVVKRFRDLARASRAAAPVGRSAPHGTGGHAGEILLDGEHLVQEALACDIPVELAAFSARQVGNVLSPLSRLARDVRKRGGRSILVSDQVLAA